MMTTLQMKPDTSGAKAQNSVLIVSKRSLKCVYFLENFPVQMSFVQTEGDCAEALGSQDHKIIIYDDICFEHDAASIIGEIARQATSSVICINTDSADSQYHASLLQAGADEIFLSDVSQDAFLQHFKPLLRQAQRNREMAEQTHRLHAINIIAQKLANAEHPMSLIVDAIDSICQSFHLYGVAMSFNAGLMKA